MNRRSRVRRHGAFKRGISHGISDRALLTPRASQGVGCARARSRPLARPRGDSASRQVARGSQLIRALAQKMCSRWRLDLGVAKTRPLSSKPAPRGTFASEEPRAPAPGSARCVYHAMLSRTSRQADLGVARARGSAAPGVRDWHRERREDDGGRVLQLGAREAATRAAQRIHPGEWQHVHEVVLEERGEDGFAPERQQDRPVDRHRAEVFKLVCEAGVRQATLERETAGEG